MAGTLVVDSSTVLCWVLQQQRWQAVQRFIDTPGIDLVLPAPGLTEVVYKARMKGNVTAPRDIAATLTTNGFQIEPLDVDDLIVAAELLEMSRANPGPIPPHSALNMPSTLSLGDGLILAVAHRLNCAVLGRDKYWGWLKDQGHLTLNIQVF